MFKEASRKKLRIQTVRGLVNIEQVWGLSLTDLKLAIQDYHERLGHKQVADELEFLETTVVKEDSEEQLIFNILKDVYTTKKDERDSKASAAETKAHNDKILALIAQKKEQGLAEMSIEDLEKQLIK